MEMFTEEQKRRYFPVVVILVLASMVLYFYMPAIRTKSEELAEKIPKRLTLDDIQVPMELTLSSPEFKTGGSIPDKFTCNGENVNPRLEISGAPLGTQSLVLIVDDPDAPVGTWDHWIVFNIDPSTTAIEENSIPIGAVLGLNDFGHGDYGGPCPPIGEHRYFFKLYALDKMLELGTGANKDEIEKEILDHVLDKSELVGRYGG
jgi:Raf kinase inhibitor-like YbhB/YbcL family protein